MITTKQAGFGGDVVAAARKGISAPFRLLSTPTPKWMYPLFAAATVSPVVGYEIHKRLKEKQDAKLSVTEKIGSAIEAVQAQPQKTLQGLEHIKSLMRQSKERAVKQQDKGAPSLEFTETN